LLGFEKAFNVKGRLIRIVPRQGTSDANCSQKAPMSDNRSMTMRRGNSNWGKPDTAGPVEASPTSFEQIVEQFGLTPDQYVKSARLHEWARTNKNSKFIPESLLKAWGLEGDSDT
jgi:hypothetical protein